MLSNVFLQMHVPGRLDRSPLWSKYNICAGMYAGI